jgi:hypothetical protein
MQPERALERAADNRALLLEQEASERPAKPGVEFYV